MAEKIFIGKVEIKETQWGEIIKIAFNPEDKKKLEQYSNNSGWTNISILSSKNGGKYATIDTYSPSTDKPKPKQVMQGKELDLETIPF
jgi:hypothetical protein